MPLFNPYLLRLIFHQGNSGTGILYLKHLDQIRELIGVGLVYWNVSVWAYRFRDNAVRRLLARGVQLKDLELFQHVYETAWKYYSAEARSPGYLHRHLVSVIYHLANAQLGQEKPEIGNALNWVNENIESWIGAQWPEVLKMWNTGMNDPALLEEMKDLIGLKTFGEITDCLESHQ